MKNVLPEIIADLEANEPLSLAPDVPGMTSPRVRMLLHRCVAAIPPEEAYLEIGCLRGSTLISALLDHKEVTAYACDIHLDDVVKKLFNENLDRYKSRLPELTFFAESCWEVVKKAPFKKPIGVYFYDGGHGEIDQKKAIVQFKQFLAPESIVIVDDWNWPWVKKGTMAGIEEIKPKNVWFQELLTPKNGYYPGFWNGIGAFHLQL
jgi:precorrin-6B methylase 2